MGSQDQSANNIKASHTSIESAPELHGLNHPHNSSYVNQRNNQNSLYIEDISADELDEQYLR